MNKIRLISVWVLVCGLSGPLLAAGKVKNLPSSMKKYDTKYYVLYSDHSPDMVREASVRLGAMAELYNKRTKGFGKKIRKRCPFYMFTKAEDYQASGGTPGSWGLYDGAVLRAIITSDRSWWVVQHEGWHQFMDMAIGGRMPIWINEGMAEYFSDGIWTGDELVTGAVDADRRKAVVQLIRAKKMMPIEQMMKLTGEEWSAQQANRNYLQAWSMIYFLVHAEDGEYSKALGKCIKAISRGKKATAAWKKNFSSNTKSFSKKYEKYWLAMEEDVDQRVRDKALLMQLCTLLHRTQVMGKKFDTMAEFIAFVDAGEFKMSPKKHKALWLPESLAKTVVKDMKKSTGTWTLEQIKKMPAVVVTRNDTRRIATFTPRKTETKVKIRSQKIKPKKEESKKVKPKKEESAKEEAKKEES
jgi:hypothetical protein